MACCIRNRLCGHFPSLPVLFPPLSPQLDAHASTRMTSTPKAPPQLRVRRRTDNFVTSLRAPHLGQRQEEAARRSPPLPDPCGRQPGAQARPGPSELSGAEVGLFLRYEVAGRPAGPAPKAAPAPRSRCRLPPALSLIHI